jgi:1-acyl-sn-glycerol-3-phosphate acyltransferase
LFESAIAARALIWPVGISYHRDDGSVDTDLAFLGSQSLVASLMNVLTRPATQVRLSFASPVDSSAGDRYRLAESCRRAVEQSLVAHRKLVAPCRMPTGAHSEEPFSLLTSA